MRERQRALLAQHPGAIIAMESCSCFTTQSGTPLCHVKIAVARDSVRAPAHDLEECRLQTAAWHPSSWHKRANRFFLNAGLSRWGHFSGPNAPESIFRIFDCRIMTIADWGTTEVAGRRFDIVVSCKRERAFAPGQTLDWLLSRRPMRQSRDTPAHAGWPPR